MAPSDSVIWLRGYREVMEVFQARDAFAQASYDEAKPLVFDDVLVTIDGNRHAQRRRLEMPVFHQSVVRSLESNLIPAITRAQVEDAVAVGRADLVVLAQRVSSALAAESIGYGDVIGDQQRLDDLARLTSKLHEGATAGYSVRPLEELAAEVVAARSEYQESFFIPGLRKARALGAGAPGASVRSATLLELLVRHEKTFAYDEDSIMRETIHFLVAGSHTTSTSIVQAASDVFLYSDQRPDISNTNDLAFLRCAVHETLRLHPPSAWALRRATRTYTLESGETVADGSIVGLDLRAANRDESVFGADAEVFDPYRQSPTHAPRYGAAFGSGSHVCMGKRLAAGRPADRACLADGDGDFGVIAEALAVLFKCGMKPDQSKEPQLNPHTRREQYSTYPIWFSLDPAMMAS